MKEEQLPIGHVTQDKINEWKAAHKYGIYAIEVAGHIGYFKNPGRDEINCAMAKADSEKVLAVFEELAALTYLGGSETILTDDQMFVGVSQEMKVKLDGKKATLVNL